MAGHELTVEEARARFLAHVRSMVDYWVADARTPDVRGKCEGVAFSILVALDGEAMAVPGYVVAPAPHPDDRAYLQGLGEDWYPEAPTVACDIAGGLHDHLFHKEETP